MSLDHLSEEGLAELEEIEVPFSIIFLLFILLPISCLIHFNRHLYIFWINSQDFSQDTLYLDNSSGCDILLVFYFPFQL